MTTSADDSPAAQATSPEATSSEGTSAGVVEPATYRDEPRRQLPRRGPALIFLGVIAVVAIGGFALALASSSPKPSPPALGKVKGSNIAAASAASFLAKIAVSGEPPANVSDAIVVPAGSTLTTFHRVPDNLELFDGSITLSAPDQASALVSFYRLELAHDGWKVTRTDATASGNGTEVFGTIAGSDGFYWEVEITLESTNPSVSPALGGGDATASSSVSLRLVELNDED